MNSIRQTFKFICLALNEHSFNKRDVNERLKTSLERNIVTPESLIEVSSANLILPALLEALEKRQIIECLPKEAHKYLSYLHQLNEEKNQTLKQQAVILASALNKISVKPIFLKSAAVLISKADNSFGWRTIRDLDILVSEEKITESAKCIKELGYVCPFPESELQYNINERHYPPLLHSETKIIVELHTQLGGIIREILPSEEVFKHSQEINLKSTNIFVPATKHQLLHSVIHSQLDAENFFFTRISFRHLYNFVRDANEINSVSDWEFVKQIMTEHQLLKKLEEHCYLAKKFFNWQIPENIPIHFSSKTHYLSISLCCYYPKLRRCLYLYRSTTQSLRRSFSKQSIENHFGSSSSFIKLTFNRSRWLFFLIKKYLVAENRNLLAKSLREPSSSVTYFE